MSAIGRPGQGLRCVTRVIEVRVRWVTRVIGWPSVTRVRLRNPRAAPNLCVGGTMTACDLVEQLLAKATRSLDRRAAERAGRHLATCKDCWARSSGRPAAGDRPPAVVVTLTCRFCHDPLARGAAAFCAACLAPHHADCWREHGRCTVLGCGEARSIRPGAVEPAPGPRGVAVGAAAALLLLALGVSGLAVVERRRAARLAAQVAARPAPQAPPAPPVPPLLSVTARDASLGELAYEVARVAGTKVDLPAAFADRLVRKGEWSAARWDRVLAEAAEGVGLRVSIDPAAVEVPTALTVLGDVAGPAERAGDVIPVTVTQRVTLGPWALDTLHRGHDHRALPSPDGRAVAILDGPQLRVVGGGAAWGDGRPMRVPAGLTPAWSTDGKALALAGARGVLVLTGGVAEETRWEARPAWSWSLFPAPGEARLHTAERRHPPAGVADLLGGPAAGATWAGPDLVVWTPDGRLLRQGGRVDAAVECEGQGLDDLVAGLPDGRFLSVGRSGPERRGARLAAWSARTRLVGQDWATMGRWLTETPLGARVLQVDRAGQVALVASRFEARVHRLPADERSPAGPGPTIRARRELGPIALAPDGRHVAWVEEGAAFLRDVDCECGADGPIVLTDGRPVLGVAWRDDSTALAVRTDLSVGVLEGGSMYVDGCVIGASGLFGLTFPSGPSRLVALHAEEGLRSVEWSGPTLVVQASRAALRRPWLVVRPLAEPQYATGFSRLETSGVHHDTKGDLHANIRLPLDPTEDGVPRAIADATPLPVQRRASPFDPVR